MGDGARGREAEGTGGQRLLHDGLHGLDVLGRGRFVVRAPITHDVGADGSVGHLRSHIDRPLPVSQRVEILREALPPPGHAFGQRRAGDVFHAFHQADEPVVSVGARRGKADAAISHHQRGHPVPAARSEHFVPRRLAVVVGVDVYPARRHEQAVGVDRLATLLPREVSHIDDVAVVDGHVGRAGF